MAVQVFPEIGSSWKTSSTGSAKYECYAQFDPTVDDEADVQAAILASLSGSYVGFNYKDLDIKEIAYGIIKATANYAAGEIHVQPAAGDPSEPSEFSFEIDSNQVKIFSSFSVVTTVNASGETIPDNGTLIGVQPDGTIEGIEVPQMTYSFSEVHNFKTVTNAQKAVLASLVGTVNFGAAFREAAAGEAMLAGISGSRQSDEFWKLRYRWMVIPNMTAQSIGGLTITKKGWDYIEFFTRDTENTTNKKVEKKLIGAKIHRVMREGDFSLLGLGS
jgi:hypothetical protein